MNRRELIVRAWKDPEYRASLSPQERAELPESPAGSAGAELSEAELDLAAGGGGPVLTHTITLTGLIAGLRRLC